MDFDFDAEMRGAGFVHDTGNANGQKFIAYVRGLTGHTISANTVTRWRHGDRGKGNAATLALAVAVCRQAAQLRAAAVTAADPPEDHDGASSAPSPVIGPDPTFVSPEAK